MTGTDMVIISASVLAGAAAGGRWIAPRLHERFFESVHPLYEVDDAAAAYVLTAAVSGALAGLLAWLFLR